MADIQLRFDADMLVLSTPVETQLARLGLNTERDNELMLMLEPEALEEIYALEVALGAQCLVTDTASITPARLARVRMEKSADKIAQSAVDVCADQSPQHILAEIGPCGLPLDQSSKASLNENLDQYKRGALAFADVEEKIDAFFLNGFERTVDLKCALMGLRKVTDKPIFASVEVDGAGVLPSGEAIEDAVAVMAEYGAQVAGVATSAATGLASRIVRRMAAVNSMLPRLVQLRVSEVDPELPGPTADNPYPNADAMVDAAEVLRVAGAQFLRAVGAATPSYTGALFAATTGDAVIQPEAEVVEVEAETNLDELADRLRVRIDAALAQGRKRKPEFRDINEDDDGYHPYCDVPASNPVYEEDPWR